METNSRDFMKLSDSGLGIKSDQITDKPQGLWTAGAKKSYSICPYCSVGCGVIVHSSGGRVIYTEGDPENPVSEGALCAKGAALTQLVNSPERLTKPKYRAPGSSEWREVEWDWVLDRIAERLKDSRDRTFKHTSKSKVTEKDADGREILVEKDFVVNRTDSIVSIGSAGLNGEECFLIQKLMRSWGIIYFDDKTRT